MLNRKHILSTLFSLFIFLQSFSQDSLFLMNGESISVRILKVYESSVKLKKSNELNSPIYVYQNDEISLIKYYNGIIDYFDLTKKPVNASVITVPNTFQYPKITYINARRCYIELKPWREIDTEEGLTFAENLSIKKNLTDLKKLALQTRRNSRRKKAFAIAGLPFTVIGLGALGFALISYDRYYDPYPTYRFGGITFGVGAGLEIASLINGIRKKKRMKKTFDLYNKYAGNS